MVATLALFAIVASMGVPLLSTLLEAYGMARVMAPAASEGTLAMERMVREVRNAQGTVHMVNRSITFVSATGDATQLHQTHASDPGIYLVKNGEERLLAQAVEADSLTFDRFDPLPLVGISFTLSATLADGTIVRTPLSTAVHVAQ